MKRVERIKDLNVRGFWAQGIVSADAIIHICTVWSQVVGRPPTASGGFLAGRISSCQFGFCLTCSAGYFWNPYRKRSIPAN